MLSTIFLPPTFTLPKIKPTIECSRLCWFLMWNYERHLKRKSFINHFAQLFCFLIESMLWSRWNWSTIDSVTIGSFKYCLVLVSNKHTHTHTHTHNTHTHKWQTHTHAHTHPPPHCYKTQGPQCPPPPPTWKIVATPVLPSGPRKRLVMCVLLCIIIPFSYLFCTNKNVSYNLPFFSF